MNITVTMETIIGFWFKTSLSVALLLVKKCTMFIWFCAYFLDSVHIKQTDQKTSTILL